MADFGLTSTGFKLKRLSDILSDLNAGVTSTFGSFNTAADSAMGQFMGIFAAVAAERWEVDEDVYFSQYPATAEGVSLDNASELVGVIRLAASKSLALASISGNESTLVPAGSIIKASSTNDTFSAVADGIITQANALAITCEVTTAVDSTSYTVIINGGPYTYVSDSSATVEEIANGLVTAINGTTEPVVAAYVSDGIFTVTTTVNAEAFNFSPGDNLQTTARTSPLYFQADTAGPILVLANTLNVIVTPIAGWSTVTNLDDGVTGRNAETDIELRARRNASLRISGSASIEAIRAKLLQDVANVTNVIGYENRTETTDGDGRPPHSFEMVIVGGSSADIGNKLWQIKPAGIQTYGNDSYSVTDSNGDPQVMYFSRPTNVYIWIKCTVTVVDVGLFPENGLTAIAQALADFGSANFSVGDSIIYQRFVAPVFATVSEGVVTVAITLATSVSSGGPAGAYSAANVTIDPSEIGIFDLARVEMTLA